MNCDRCDSAQNCAPSLIHAMGTIKIRSQEPAPAGLIKPGQPQMVMVEREVPHPLTIAYVGCQSCRLERINLEMSAIQNVLATKTWFEAPKKVEKEQGEMYPIGVPMDVTVK